MVEEAIGNNDIHLTDEDFSKFKNEAERWLEIFGMTDYKVEFQFQELEECYAQTLGTPTGRRYLITLNSVWKDELRDPDYKDEILMDGAYHESCEAFLYRIRQMALGRDSTADEIDSEIHALIHKLQKAFPKYRNMNVSDFSNPSVSCVK